MSKKCNNSKVVTLLAHSSVHSHRADYYRTKLPALPGSPDLLLDVLAKINTQLSSVVQTSHYSTWLLYNLKHFN